MTLLIPIAPAAYHLTDGFSSILSTSLFHHHKWPTLDADVGVSDEGAVVEEVEEVGEVVAALARMRRRIGTLPALRVLVLLEAITVIEGSRLPSSVVL
jgi:hypothetical protein